MCGIAGFVNLAGQPADREIVERMTATLTHRGPDGDWLLLPGSRCAWPSPPCRSSTCPAAPRRCRNEDGSVWITYNGEIYNELELRKELETKGHRYRTSCDTETLVHLYEEEGLDFARRLNGMFAAAIWDANRNRLVLVRDRMGQKPLFYATARIRRAGLRLRAQGRSDPSRHRPSARPREFGPLPVLRICARPPLDLAIDAQASPRPCPLLGRTAHSGSGNTGSHPCKPPTSLISKAAAGRFWASCATPSRAIGARTCPSASFFPEVSTLRAWPRHSASSSRPATSAPFRSALKIPASTRAATPEPSPAIWVPTITSRPFRSRRSISSCQSSQAGSTNRLATRRSCQLISSAGSPAKR